MGQIIQASFSEILPGEDGFNNSQLLDIFRFAERGLDILPVPVREYNGKYLHLDGRHRLLYHKIRGEESVWLYLLESREDFMSEEVFPDVPKVFLWENNDNIYGRWSGVEYNCNEIYVKDYNEYFERLAKNNGFLRDEKSCRTYLNFIFPDWLK
ncbi:hypothetical protein J4474_04425 [Candidatus Pacearchaeota archaeon]|nr:hypothetical protein [Candidatus Pacearchaeota archaeon]